MIKTYERYKPSGVEWIGDIPERWKIKKLKYVVLVKARLGWKGLKASEYVTEGFGFLSTPNIKNKEIDFENINFINEERYFESPEIMLESGDVLLAKDGSTLGTVNVVKHLPFPSTVNSSIAVLRVTEKRQLDSSFLKLFIESDLTQKVIQKIKDGMGVPHLFQADIREFDLLLPPLPEQTAIANYLDEKTAQIDKLITGKRRLITLLKEERSGVINNAITRGINPHAKLKPSGIDWLGEIPEHCRVVPLTKYLESIIDYRGKTPTKSESGVFLVTARNIKNGEINYALSQEYILEEEYKKTMSRGELQIGDVLFTTEAPLGEAANVDRTDVAVAQRVIKFRGKKDVLNNYFLKHWILSPMFQQDLYSYSTGSTAIGIKGSKLFHLRLLLPPIREQERILDYISEQSEQSDATVAKIEKEIEYLREYRTALISEVVTGKIKVV